MSGLAARRADRAVCIGPGPAAQSYLRDDVVVQAALGTGCDAIHPGYGFLSESPKLAARARENGLVFVGPPAEVIELSGDKLRAREEAAGAAVPVLPGQEVGSADEAHRVAERIGYPLLVKAAGGGGGRGIKLARDGDELDGLLSLARSEAGAAFGDDRLYLERFIAAARHVEVQIAADEHGEVVHLGERDCSVQRRYQKVIEEAPAPGPRVGRPRRDPRRRRALRPRDRLPQPGHGRVRRRRRHRRALLPRDQLPDPGRAPGDRGGHRPRPGRAAVADRRRRAARVRPGGRGARRPRDRMPAERRGRGARLHAHARDAVAVLGARPARPARRHALLPGRRRSRRTTTR